MTAWYSLYNCIILYSVFLSFHHLFFGVQVYHGLLLNLFKLSFQCIYLTALVVPTTTIALYWLYFCIFSLSLSFWLHTSRIALHSWKGPSYCPPRETHVSSDCLLYFMHSSPCARLCLQRHAPSLGFADHAPFPWCSLFGFSRLHFIFDHLSLKDRQ